MEIIRMCYSVAQKNEVLLRKLEEIFSMNLWLSLTKVIDKNFIVLVINLPFSYIEKKILDDEYPVLFLVSALTKKNYRAEGNYSLRLDDTVSLTRQDHLVQQFSYSDIIWVAIGENLLGIFVENCGLFEFICDQPLLIIAHLRKYIKFKNTFPAVKLDMKRNYNRFYHQEREIIARNLDTSPTSTLESRSITTVEAVQINQSHFFGNEEEKNTNNDIEKCICKIPSRKCSIFSEFFKRFMKQ
ncbi:hypothetical protein DICVIV_10327 [Dictyocaulus viviparus]|uniref:Uncharacterized protein n=1 Tax=Dictyocaulus viviparus TaxID=29172 RepID=A0A0D8XGA9_DICVI|nr:hypothetical protein DICVIV_10327 [Dictyocaulus viviparus]